MTAMHQVGKESVLSANHKHRQRAKPNSENLGSPSDDGVYSDVWQWRYEYDELGRLIRVVRTLPAPAWEGFRPVRAKRSRT